MQGFPDCRVCCEGVLVPFYGPEGHVVYFCNNCMARFSGYYEEPLIDGIPVFSELAFYITEDDLEGELSLTSGELMDQFKEVLEELPPDPLPLEGEGCPYCAGPLGPEGKCADMCFLPKV